MTTAQEPPDPTSTRLSIAAEVKAQTEAAIAESERRILSGIQKAVSEAVETKYKVVVAQLGENNSSKKSNSHAWPIVMAVIPVLLTILLGGYINWRVSRVQSDINTKLDAQKQELTTRLAITQEYQKGKLNAYIACTQTLKDLLAALETLSVDPNEQKAVTDGVAALNDYIHESSLYVTKNVAEPLAKAQEDAIAVMQQARKGHIDITAFERDRAEAEKRMLDELTGVTVQLEPSR